jgi:hypothetical protein
MDTGDRLDQMLKQFANSLQEQITSLVDYTIFNREATDPDDTSEYDYVMSEIDHMLNDALERDFPLWRKD